MNLSVMYRATQAISNVLDIDALSPQILELVFESIGADRGAILLKDEAGQLVPKAVRWRDRGRARRADDDLAARSSTTCSRRGRGSSPPMPPATSGSAPRSRSSITRSARRSACRSRGGTPLWACSMPTSRPASPAFARPTSRSERRDRFTQDQLMLMVAIGHQAGLAIENTQFLQRQDPGRAAGRRRPDHRHAVAPHQEHPPGHPRRQLPDRPGPEREGRVDRPPRLDDRREEPDARSTTWSWTCSRSPRTASRRSSRPT